MKKILFVFLALFVLTGCSSNKKTEPIEIKGYWQQLERDVSGDIDDMRSNPYAYMEITENRIYFYTENSEDKGYIETIAEKYYILEGNKLYYDYYKLEGEDWKKKISDFGGMFVVSFDKENLILKESYGETDYEGYNKGTYKKMEDSFRLKDYDDDK